MATAIAGCLFIFLLIKNVQIKSNINRRAYMKASTHVIGENVTVRTVGGEELFISACTEEISAQNTWYINISHLPLVACSSYRRDML